MLIQCDYQTGDYLLKGGSIYYKGNLIVSRAISPILEVGGDELYVIEPKFPLACEWLVIVQSRFPVFYECRRVEFETGRVVLWLTDGKILAVKPYKNGFMDRLLVDPISSI